MAKILSRKFKSKVNAEDLLLIAKKFKHECIKKIEKPKGGIAYLFLENYANDVNMDLIMFIRNTKK